MTDLQLQRIKNSDVQVATIPMVRIDRNIVHNIGSIFDLFGIGGSDMDDNLLRAVIYYLCFSYQQNLFSYSVIDPYEFAQQMGYTSDFLRQRHPHPVFLEDLKKMPPEAREGYVRDGYPTYSSNFENALYALWKREVLFSYGVTFFNNTDKEEKLTHQNVRLFILRNLRVDAVRSGKTRQRKTVYSVELDERFIHSLTQYFVRGKMATLVELRKSKLDILYLKMLQYKENAFFQNDPAVEINNFSMLCRWAGVAERKKDGSSVPNKKRKQLLAEALHTLNEKTDLNYAFETTTSRGQKFPYTFRITFSITPQAITQKEEDSHSDMACMFSETLMRDMFGLWKMYRNNGGNPYCIDTQKFNEWLHADADYDEKKNVYLVAATKIFGKWKSGQVTRESQFHKWFMRAVQHKASE
ncbi:MAG: hypothetical protein LBL94_08525 [Prevotellaceae bacterium]|jgi:hypothetical protein|nr:hypothetical protein [Prevotellaceae bacterium]